MINEIPSNCIIKIGRNTKLLESVLKFLEENTIVKWSGRGNPTSFDKYYYSNVNYLIIQNNDLGYSSTEDFVKTTHPYNTYPLVKIPNNILKHLYYD